MANAKVSIAYDEVFAQVFNGYTVEVSTEAEPSRIITFDSNGKCNSTYKGNVRTATQTIQLEAAKWYKLNIKTSASGRIDMGISVDDTVEEKPQDVEVNPYL